MAQKSAVQPNASEKLASHGCTWLRNQLYSPTALSDLCAMSQWACPSDSFPCLPALLQGAHCVIVTFFATPKVV